MEHMSRRQFIDPLAGLAGQATPTPVISFTQIAAKLSDEMWKAVYGKSSRKVRNMLEGMFSKAKGKSKKKGGMVSLKSKNRDRAHLEVRQGMLEEENEQLCEEVFKTWFMAHQSLLEDSLDYFGIAHKNGITDDELTAIEEATAEKLNEFLSHMEEKGHKLEEVSLYLAFVQAENLTKSDKAMDIFKTWQKDSTAPQPDPDPFAETEADAAAE